MRLRWLLIIGVILGGGVSWSGEIEYNFGGQYRYRQNWVSDFPTDDRGRELGQEFYQESRLRTNFQIQANSRLQVNLQADFFTGLLEGDEADLRLGYARWPWDSLEIDPDGAHGFQIPEPQKAFDLPTYMINKIGRYFQTRGGEILDDLCLEDHSCVFIPAPPK